MYIPVPIVLTATGACLGDSTSTTFLRSMEGGCQGDGGATLGCVGPYFEALCDVQRRCPTTDITGTADDTYFFDECAPRADGSLPPLFATYDDKRAECEASVGVVSVLRKTKLTTGDARPRPRLAALRRCALDRRRRHLRLRQHP